MEMKNRIDRNKVIGICVFATIALVSIFILAKIFSSTEFHKASIEFLDNKKLTVASLTIGVNAAATLIASMIGDATTPVANQLASASTWLLMITCVIVAEKYLITLIGYISFTYIIPIACAMYAIFIITNKQFLREFAIKLGIFGLAIFLIIPTSVQITRALETSHSEAIELTDAQAIENNIQEELDAVEEDKGILDKATDFLVGAGEKAIDTIKAEISKFMDAIAILLVTTCIVPIVVLYAFSWLLRIVFNLNISVPKRLTTPFAKKSE